MSELTNSNHGEEYDRSLELFKEPSTYVPFSVSPDGRRQGFCIDPRIEDGVDQSSPMLVTVQSPGGGVGEVRDSKLVAKAAGEDLSPEEAVNAERIRRATQVLGTHGLFGDSCRYQQGEEIILGEMANPGDLTKFLMSRLMRPYEHVGSMGDAVGRMSIASAMELERLQADEAEHGLAALIDGQYPDVDNIRTVVGENHALFYISNFHPLLGLDRNKVHVDAGLVIPGYHDSIGASINDLDSVPHGQRANRVAARMLRTAATQTVLTGAHNGNMTFLEVVPTPDGPEVNEVLKLAA